MKKLKVMKIEKTLPKCQEEHRRHWQGIKFIFWRSLFEKIKKQGKKSINYQIAHVGFGIKHTTKRQ